MWGAREGTAWGGWGPLGGARATVLPGGCAHERSVPPGTETVLKIRKCVGSRKEAWSSAGLQVPPVRPVTSLPPCAAGVPVAGSNGGQTPRSVLGCALTFVPRA